MNFPSVYVVLGTEKKVGGRGSSGFCWLSTGLSIVFKLVTFNKRNTINLYQKGHLNSLLMIGICLSLVNLIVVFVFVLNLDCVVLPSSRAAAIPRAKGGTILQMKLVYNQLAPLVLLFLQWMDCSCAGFLHKYLNLFHVIIYKVPMFFVVILLCFTVFDSLVYNTHVSCF